MIQTPPQIFPKCFVFSFFLPLLQEKTEPTLIKESKKLSLSMWHVADYSVGATICEILFCLEYSTIVHVFTHIHQLDHRHTLCVSLCRRNQELPLVFGKRCSLRLFLQCSAFAISSNTQCISAFCSSAPPLVEGANSCTSYAVAAMALSCGIKGQTELKVQGRCGSVSR